MRGSASKCVAAMESSARGALCAPDSSDIDVDVIETFDAPAKDVVDAFVASKGLSVIVRGVGDEHDVASEQESADRSSTKSR